MVTTASGGLLRVVDPDPETILLDDVATGLSNICRYNGQVPVGVFLSVAEHCVVLHDHVMETTGDRVLAMDALTHDMAEAYLGDVISPLKKSMTIDGVSFSDVEEDLLFDIRSKLCPEFPLVICEETREIDNRVVADEWYSMGYDIAPPEWITRREPLGVLFEHMTPDVARVQWLSRFGYGRMTMTDQKPKPTPSSGAKVNEEWREERERVIREDAPVAGGKPGSADDLVPVLEDA